MCYLEWGMGKEKSVLSPSPLTLTSHLFSPSGRGPVWCWACWRLYSSVWVSRCLRSLLLPRAFSLVSSVQLALTSCFSASRVLELLLPIMFALPLLFISLYITGLLQFIGILWESGIPGSAQSHLNYICFLMVEPYTADPFVGYKLVENRQFPRAWPCVIPFHSHFKDLFSWYGRKHDLFIPKQSLRGEYKSLAISGSLTPVQILTTHVRCSFLQQVNFSALPKRRIIQT